MATKNVLDDRRKPGFAGNEVRELSPLTNAEF